MQNLNHTKTTCLAARLPDGQCRFACRMALQALTIIILLITCITSFAQNRNTINSLKTIINNKKVKDTTIIQAYIDLSYEYKNINLDTALSYSDSALTKSLKGNYKKGIGEAYRRKGVTMTRLNKYISADSLLNMAIPIYSEINLQTGVMECYVDLASLAQYKGEYRQFLEYSMKALKNAEDNNLIKYKSMILINIGIAYKEIGDYEKAIEYALNALNFFEELDNKNMIALCYSSLGNLYIETEEYNKSLKYIKKALKLYVELKETRKQSICYTNMGKIYFSLGKLNKTLKNYNNAFELLKKNKDLRGTSLNYMNIGNVYLKLAKYDKANESFNKSLEISKQIGDKNSTAECYYYISILKTKQKNYSLAKEYCLKSTELFEQNKELYNQQKSLEQLAVIYKLTREYQKAYNTYFKAVAIKDSLFSIEKVRKITQLEERYLNEKLEKQNLTLIYENEIQQSKINHHEKTHIIYFIILLLSITAITIILIQYRKKNNAYKFLVRKNIDLLNKEMELKILKEKITLNGSNNNRKITINDNIKNEILKKLTQLLDNEKVYKDLDLTIDKLAKSISTNRNYLSQTIYNNTSLYN